MTAAESGTDSVAYTYDNNRNLLTETINGTLSQINTFNKANQAVSVQNKKGTTQQSLFNYTYSENGNMTAVQENLDSASSRAFTYDGMGRLTAETRDGNTTNYTYDAYSNRASKNSESYLYDANNRLTTKTVGNAESLYNYDNNGNLYSSLTSTTATAGEEDISISESISDQDAMYTFDGLNRLTNLTADGKNIVYVYDGDGKRVSKTVDGITTDYVWDGDFIVMEKTGDSVTLYKRALRLFASEKNGVKKFYRYNARGDVAQLVNVSGTVTKNYEHDAFGNELSPNETDTNPFRYCGEYFDNETGYIYLRARYYDPNIGRFISEDPIRDGLNWYVYCHCDPINFKDPTGLEENPDKKILSPIDYMIIMALTEEYNYFNSWKEKDYAKLDAIRREAVAIRQKPEYRDQYNAGIYIDTYNYSTSKGEKYVRYFVDDSTTLNFEHKGAATVGFLGGFVQPFGWVISAAVTAADPEMSYKDVLAEAAGNIKKVGPLLGVASFMKELLTNRYNIKDSRIQIQLHDSSTRVTLEHYTYYWIQAETIVKTNRHFVQR